LVASLADIGPVAPHIAPVEVEAVPLADKPVVAELDIPDHRADREEYTVRLAVAIQMVGSTDWADMVAVAADSTD
jgi:hypothetical protein